MRRTLLAVALAAVSAGLVATTDTTAQAVVRPNYYQGFVGYGPTAAAAARDAIGQAGSNGCRVTTFGTPTYKNGLWTDWVDAWCTTTGGR